MQSVGTQNQTIAATSAFNTILGLENSMLKHISIVKCHGSGNDFVLVDEYTNEFNLTEDQRRFLAIKFSDRKGIGADGVIFFSKSKIADAKSRIFNADGSEAELCGNGIRCVARYASELHNKPELKIETIKSVYNVKREKNIYDNVFSYSVEIDTVSLISKEIPIVTKDEKVLGNIIPGFYEDMRFYGVSLTNPHLISIVDSIDLKLLGEVGKAANANKNIFPRGINVSFCRILNDTSIQVETFERGVGFTYSCGTAMSSSTLVCSLLDQEKFGKYINVYNGGGMVQCRAKMLGADKYSINLLGNATFVFKSNVDFDFAHPELKSFGGNLNLEEVSDYKKLLDHTREILSNLTSAKN